MSRKKVLTLLWASHGPILRRIKDKLNVELDIADESKLESDNDVDELVRRVRSADVAVI